MWVHSVHMGTLCTRECGQCVGEFCACGCILCTWVRYVRVSSVNVWVGSVCVGAFCAHGYAMYV